ncbi:BRCT domain protein [Aspergillus saccharolyticus JOP 1030-1]|uniref:BRCT domain-containing protein n=1 Tax=Aspergillus saccharolyticus JOP 1030-1 TaxID=1450539 RepID=A0A318ZLL3_9EURO|nr:hypothetical protein BP01DRAFT_147643 [Aspergillus saccharolyticus JOP 1030-1]PYH48416.1 hypothetical protein BP01DRAFT_147643 [Aspergillus saccharolyticus JOP 1030-1]
MGKTFQKIHACSAGTFPKDGNKISQWVRANGGEYSPTVTPQVTHLITTLEAYKKNIKPVREAKELKHIKIVTFDWLEDSLLDKGRKPRRVTKYLLNTIVGNEEKKQQQQQATKKSADAKARAKKTGATKRLPGRIKNPDPFGKATARFKAGTAAGKGDTLGAMVLVYITVSTLTSKS